MFFCETISVSWEWHISDTEVTGHIRLSFWAMPPTSGTAGQCGMLLSLLSSFWAYRQHYCIMLTEDTNCKTGRKRKSSIFFSVKGSLKSVASSPDSIWKKPQDLDAIKGSGKLSLHQDLERPRKSGCLVVVVVPISQFFPSPSMHFCPSFLHT